MMVWRDKHHSTPLFVPEQAPCFAAALGALGAIPRPAPTRVAGWRVVGSPARALGVAACGAAPLAPGTPVELSSCGTPISSLVFFFQQLHASTATSSSSQGYNTSSEALFLSESYRRFCEATPHTHEVLIGTQILLSRELLSSIVGLSNSRCRGHFCIYVETSREC
jgi:hypothetical protein